MRVSSRQNRIKPTGLPMPKFLLLLSRATSSRLAVLLPSAMSPFRLIGFQARRFAPLSAMSRDKRARVLSMSRKRIDIGARLRRSRAVSVCLGRRFWYMTPLDRHPGRPTVRESILLSQFKKPILDFDPELYEDQDTDAFKEGLLIDAADKYLAAVGLEQGWFQVVERANLLGTHVTIRVRDFDILVHRASVLDRCVGHLESFADRRFPFTGKGAACG